MKTDFEQSPRIFVSYSTHQANIVRPVVERLLAHGFQVWFAEYKVLTQNYEEFDAAIDKELSTAISNSTHALVFTSQSWFDSDYCKEEMKCLAAHFKNNPAAILQISHGSAKCLGIFQALLTGTVNCPVAMDPGRLDLLLEMILMHLDPVHRIPGIAPLPVSSSKERWLCTGGYFAGIRLDGFGDGQLPIELLEPNSNGEGIRHYRCTMNGKTVRLSMTFRPQHTIHSPLPTNKEQFFLKAKNNVDIRYRERAEYHYYRQYAERWYGLEGHDDYREHGFHLFRWHGTPQLGMTFSETKTNIHGWHRMYVFQIEDPVTGIIGEITLAFSVSFDGNEPASTFAEFCRFMPWLDSMAESLDYRGKKPPKISEPIDVDRSVYREPFLMVFGGIGFLVGFYLGNHVGGLKSAIIGAIAGIFAVVLYTPVAFPYLLDDLGLRAKFQMSSRQYVRTNVGIFWVILTILIVWTPGFLKGAYLGWSEPFTPTAFGIWFLFSYVRWKQSKPADAVFGVDSLKVQWLIELPLAIMGLLALIGAAAWHVKSWPF